MSVKRSREVWPAIEIVLSEATEPLSSIQIAEQAELLGVAVNRDSISGILLSAVHSKVRSKQIRRIRTSGRGRGVTWLYYDPRVMDPGKYSKWDKDPVPMDAPADTQPEVPSFAFGPIPGIGEHTGFMPPPADPAPAPEVQVTPKAVIISLAGVSIRIELER